MISLFIEGQPLPKERPRIGRGGTAYTPAKTQAWESTIAWKARSEMGHLEPLVGDVAVYLVFYRSGNKRGDLDNLCKAVMDALNGIVYNDDKQVTQLHASVTYGVKQPGVSVKVMPTL